MFRRPCLCLRRCLGTPLASLPPFLNSQVHPVWPNAPPPTYRPTSRVYLKHHHHIDNRSSQHLIHQTPNMRVFLAPNIIIHLHCNTQPPNPLLPRTQVQNRHQTYPMTGIAFRLPPRSRNMLSLVSPWTPLRLPWPRNSRPGLP